MLSLSGTKEDVFHCPEGCAGLVVSPVVRRLTVTHRFINKYRASRPRRPRTPRRPRRRGRPAIGHSRPSRHSRLDIPLLFAHNSSVALTRRQKEGLAFIIDFVEEKGFSPSYEELARGLHLASVP